jgi:CHAD domain-containing protein
MTEGPATEVATPVETEWQFDAIDVRPVERWLAAVPEEAGPAVEAGAASTIIDTYLDTEDWRLYRAGYSLRIRRKGGAVEATLKSQEEGDGGLRRRTEFSEVLPGKDPTALLEATGPVATRAKLAAGNAPLGQLFEVRTRRREFRLLIDGMAAGEVAVDRTTIPLGDGSESARLRRVEVEVPERLVAAVGPFVESLRSACGLQIATLSKYQVGLLAKGLKPTVAPDLGSMEVDASRTIGEVAFAVLRRHLTNVLANETGTRIGDDIEDLHDMRVATRRARAALSVFRGVLPVRFSRFRDELGWVASALGAVRDLDVQLAQLDEWDSGSSDQDGGALEPLRQILVTQRWEARDRLLAALDSKRYERLVAGFTAGLRRGPLRTSASSRQQVLGAGPDLILERYRRVRGRGERITKDSPWSDYHRLRIACKRLRYTLEFLSEVYPKEVPPLVKRLVAIQDILGLHQDANVAVARLRSTVAEQSESLAPATIFAMGMVARRYEEQAEDLRVRFPKAYSRLGGTRWKALRREMKRQRPPSPPVPVLRPVGPVATVSPRTVEEKLARPQGAG